MAVFPANATLRFRAPSDNVRIGFDGTPQVKTGDFVVTASLKQKIDAVTLPSKKSDSDDSEIILEGRTVSPAALPNWILPGSKAIAHLWRVDGSFALPETFTADELDAFLESNSNQVTQTGTFFLKGSIGSRFGVQEILGDRIDGRLFLNVAWAREV